jgi:hypothetical protein
MLDSVLSSIFSAVLFVFFAALMLAPAVMLWLP